MRGTLAVTPTPLQPMDRLARELGKPPGTLLVKRDDQTGLAGGGNKARKLEYVLSDAVRRGADHVISGGGPQSNHARMTAAATARLELSCTLLLQGTRPDVASGNLLLDSLLGAHVVWTPGTDFEGAQAAMEERAAQLRASGARPYVIPIGCSTWLGALGMADSAREALAERPDVDLFVVACGSGGTQAGLAVGAGSHERVLGFRVAMQPDLGKRVATLAAGAAHLANRPAPTGQVRLDPSQLGPGYGRGTPECFAAITLAARTEGLILDPVYTGKAMAGLIAACRSGVIGRDDVVVFVHTGGMPGLLSENHAAWASALLERSAGCEVSPAAGG
jgi:D-cysteine desulfhydrase